MNRRKNRKFRSKARIRRNTIMPSNVLTHTVFASVDAGSQAECNVSQLGVLKERSLRVLSIYGTVNMLQGTTGLFEAVLYNQGQTQVATTGVISVTSGVKTKFSIRPPAKSDMWIDAGNTTSTTLKIAHFDFPCVSKLMSGFTITLNLRIKYALGKELISDKCPTLTLSKSSRAPIDNDSCSIATELNDGRRTNHEYDVESYHMC